MTSFAEAGHMVYFLPCEASAPDRELDVSNLRVNCLSALEQSESSFAVAKSTDAYEGLCSALENIKPDLVLAGPVHSGGALAALTGCSPLIVMSWGYDTLSIPCQSEYLDSLVKFALSRADIILGDCRAVKDAVSNLCPSSRDRIVCFPWGIDLKTFRPDVARLGMRREFGWESHRIIITARSMEPIHGTMTFIQAVNQVLQSDSNTRVIMVGDGTLRPCVEDFTAEHGLREKVRVVGQVSEEILPHYFAEADLYVSASSCDGSSVSMLEAMGCGLAVIVSNVGGNKEWILPRRNGWLCPVGDVDALANATKEALDDDEARRKMGQANVRIVRECADWSRNFGRFLDLCEHLVASGSPFNAPAYAWL